MSEPDNAPAWLYAEPLLDRTLYGIIYTDRAERPAWWGAPGARGIRLTPLSRADLAQPFIDIVRAHWHKLG